MLTARTEQVAVREQHDIVNVRQVVRSWSLSLGLGGTKRLVDEFDIASTPGVGTRVSITKWRSR